MRSRPGQLLGYSTIAPTVIVTVVLTGLWAWSRWGYLNGDERSAMLPTITAGWLLSMLVIASLGTIGGVAALEGVGTRRQALIAASSVAAGCGMLLMLVVYNAGTLTMADALKLYGFFLTWLLFLGAMTRLTRQLFSQGAGVILPMVLGMVLIALPVLAVPLVRASGGGIRVALTTGIAYGSPGLAMLSAVQWSLRVDLARMPTMYQLSPLGQDIPMATSAWWVSTLIYGGLTGVLVAVDVRWGRRIRRWFGGVREGAPAGDKHS